jgi:replicative DNA helicase
MNEIIENFKNKKVEFTHEFDLGLDDIKAPVDFYIKEHEQIFLVEFEIHRADPSNNLAKIAYWLEKEKPSEDVNVIQCFSPHYDTRKGYNAKRKLSEFLGKKLIEEHYSQRYHCIITDQLSKNDFNELYKSFKKDSQPNEEVIKQLKKLAGRYSQKIAQKINLE